MKLRMLKPEDAPLMLEWMHDPEVVRYMQADFAGKTLEDCKRFIQASAEPGGEDLHRAIADEEDVYQGTVSLKHIRDGRAEFAITVRKCAMGKGIAREAMAAILAFGLEEQGLNRIYWCVSPENIRAVRFYDKNGYVRVPVPQDISGYSEEQKARYIWYSVGGQHG